MKTLFLIGLLVFSQIGFSQYDVEDEDKEENKEEEDTSKINWAQLKEKTYVGGEMNLSFGSGGTYLFLAPLIGYDITPKFSAGLSTMYQLWRFRDYSGALHNFNTVGAGIFSRYRPIEKVIMQLEFDLFNTEDFYSGTNERINIPAFMAGLGYVSSVGDNAYYQIMLVYDFIDHPNMPLPPLLISPLHLKIGFIWHLR